MEKIKVIITGATGFLGGKLAKRLAKEGYDVIALGRNLKKGEELCALGIKFIAVDLSDKIKLNELFYNADYVFHCAAKSSPWGKYREFYNSNVIGTQNVVEACLNNNVKKLIYVSSPSIYFEFSDKTNIKENDKTAKFCANNYIKSKIMAEKIICNAQSKGLACITIRPRAIFGIGDSALIPRLIRVNSANGIPKTVKDDIIIDITHVDNVVEALILSMKAGKECNGEVFNITNDEPIKFYKTLEKLINSIGYQYKQKRISYKVMFFIAAVFELVYMFLSNKEPILTRYTVGLLSFSQTLDITKAKKKLGYKPIISIEEGIAEVIRSYKCK